MLSLTVAAGADKGGATTRDPPRRLDGGPEFGTNKSNPLLPSGGRNSKGAAMKTALGAFAALLLASGIPMQAQGQMQVQSGPGFSVQIGPGAPPPPEPRSEEWREERLREG